MKGIMTPNDSGGGRMVYFVQITANRSAHCIPVIMHAAVLWGSKDIKKSRIVHLRSPGMDGPASCMARTKKR